MDETVDMQKKDEEEPIKPVLSPLTVEEREWFRMGLLTGEIRYHDERDDVGNGC